MALFKISKGLSTNLMTNVPNAKEGFAYFTTDDGKFYIDIDGDGSNNTPAVIGNNRIPLNAYTSDILKATSMGTNDNVVYPLLTFKVKDSTKNLIEAKYGAMGIKNGTLVIPNVNNHDEILISNTGAGRGIVIDNTNGVEHAIEITAGKGIKVAQDPTENLELTTKQYVDNKLANKSNTGHNHDDRYYTETEIDTKLNALLGANDALVFKGIIDGEHPLPTAGYEVGHTYRVNEAGTYADQKCEQGDLIICIADALSTSTPHWTVAQTNIDGAVIGPNTSTANAVSTFADATGKVIKDNSAVTIDNTGLFTAPYIATGTDKNHTHYFQSEKFRGEGNADTYYHAIDFGYAGHDQVDFHEYGGIWNFYKNTQGTAAGGQLVASIKPDGFHGNLKGNADTATTATAATKITQTVRDAEEGNYPLLLANNGQTATTTGATYFDKSVTLNPKTNTIAANISGKANTSGTADEVANNLTIQLNNGTTEGTNQFTYNGSATKNINITPANIGAASSSHNHDSSYVKKSGDTMTGDLKFQKTNSDGTTSTTATIGATTGYITGTQLQTTSVGYKAGDFATIDGSGWIYKRTPAQARQDMGLSTAMHFIGKATVDITDGSTVDPKITGYTTKTAGDVIIDKNNSYEYVWTLEGKWERLGPDSSYSVVGHTHDDRYYTETEINGKFDEVVHLAGEETITGAKTFDLSTPNNTLTTLLKFKGNSTDLFGFGAVRVNQMAWGEGLFDLTSSKAILYKMALLGSSGGTWQLNGNALTATTATTATNDSNGNKICNTYLPLNGGTMTGAIDMNSNILSHIGHIQFGADNNNPTVLISRTDEILGVRPDLGGTGNEAYQTQLAICDTNGLGIIFGYEDKNYVSDNESKIYIQSVTGDPVRLSGILNPINDYDAVNKNYLDTTVSNTYVKKTGDTMSGNLTISHSDTNDASVRATNSNGSIGLLSSTDRGLYDYTKSKWLIYTDGTKASTSYALYGAVWNDYAEFREGDTIEAGRCVIEVGNDTLITSTERMMPGANITSDTFGFAIGETDQAKTPIAVSGRVLAYPYESREEFKKNIGRPVCSGPNGTVSIMTDEEYRNKGYCAIGTISAVPDYEEWGTGKVKVNGRVWIKVF